MFAVTLETIDPGTDFDRLFRWLAQPHVAKWWGDPDRAMHHARECDPESHALIVVDERPAGYLCWRTLSQEELESAQLADLPDGLMDIDILIGEFDLTGHGVGVRALELLLARFRLDPSVAFAGLGTSASNTNALRCFRKAGFHLYREFDDPELGPCHYLVADLNKQPGA